MKTSISFENVNFIARQDRTLFHEESRTLFLADLHLGKGLFFRTNGIPIPDDIEKSDLNRLFTAIKQTKARSVWILGDLFHHVSGITSQYLNQLKTEFSITNTLCELNLVMGNHDKGGASKANDLGFQVHAEKALWSRFTLGHHPNRNKEKKPHICGHLHPRICFSSKIDRLIFPCFAILPDRQLLLPAFTEFSGGPFLSPLKAICFPITDDGVLLPSTSEPT